MIFRVSKKKITIKCTPKELLKTAKTGNNNFGFFSQNNFSGAAWRCKAGWHSVQMVAAISLLSRWRRVGNRWNHHDLCALQQHQSGLHQPGWSHTVSGVLPGKCSALLWAWLDSMVRNTYSFLFYFCFPCLFILLKIKWLLQTHFSGSYWE